MTAPTADLPLSQFRLMTIVWAESETDTTHIVHEKDVDAFVKATVELHYSPGINPYNGGKCSVAREIYAERFAPGHAHWWATPGLGKDKSAIGATIINPTDRQSMWRSAEWDAEMREQGRIELEAELAA